MARTPARPGAVWWRSVAPPELGSVREVRALTHGAPRRQPVVGLRPPPPEANAEAIEPRHAVHVGSRMIARRAGGTLGYRPLLCGPSAPRTFVRRIRASVGSWRTSDRSRPRRPVSISPGGAMRPTSRDRTPPSTPPATFAICDRCGDVVVGDSACRCRTPYDQTAVQRRHRDAVARASASDTRRRKRRSAA